MTALIFSILASACIFLIFKLFPKWGIDTFQAIVFNYFTAFICGIALFHNEWQASSWTHREWLAPAVIASLLFISLFVIMGLSAQRNGVAPTSIAVKMSMALSVITMIAFYHEPLSVLKISGIILAIAGVVSVSIPAKTDDVEARSPWMLLVLFIGSGLLDVVLNVTQERFLAHLSPSLFSAFGFGFAGLLGLLILMVQIVLGKARFEWKNLIAGIILGIPNYFSIYLLLAAYTSTGWTDSTVLAVINVSVVGLAAVLGWLIFNEKMTKLRMIGFLGAIGAIVCIYFSEI